MIIMIRGTSRVGTGVDTAGVRIVRSLIPFSATERGELTINRATDDPYLGPSSAPHPPPQNIYPPPPRSYSPYYQASGASNSSLNSYPSQPALSVQGPAAKQFRSHSPGAEGMGPLGGERRGVTPPLPGAFA